MLSPEQGIDCGKLRDRILCEKMATKRKMKTA
jgi:hypothetical protein